MTSALLLAALTSAAPLADALLGNRVGETFDLTATVTSAPIATDNDFAVQDASAPSASRTIFQWRMKFPSQ